MSYRALKEDNCRLLDGNKMVEGDGELVVAGPLVLTCLVPRRARSNESPKLRFFSPFVPMQPRQLIGWPPTARNTLSALPRNVATLPLSVCVKAPSCTPSPNSSGTLG